MGSTLLPKDFFRVLNSEFIAEQEKKFGRINTRSEDDFACDFDYQGYLSDIKDTLKNQATTPAELMKLCDLNYLSDVECMTMIAEKWDVDSLAEYLYSTLEPLLKLNGQGDGK